MTRYDPRKAPRAWIEIGAMTALLLSYEWLWQGSFAGDALVVVLLYLSLGVSSHVRRKESMRDIGFNLDTAPRAARDVLLYVGPLVLGAILFGALLGSWSFPEISAWPRMLVGSAIWGTLQQYGLLAFYYRRFSETLPGTWSPILAAAAAFGLFHLPNPFLTLVTLVAGSVACWIYRRAPNLLVLGGAHAVLSFTISGALPEQVTLGMRVGPGYWQLLDSLQTGAAEAAVMFPWLILP